MATQIRASDEERERVARILQTAMAEGRLTLQEGDERLAAAYAATYREDLTPLTADLPEGGRPALADPPRTHELARRRQPPPAGRLALVAMVVVGLSVLAGAAVFWPAIPLAFLIFGLLARLRFYQLARGSRHWPGGRWPADRWYPGRWR